MTVESPDIKDAASQRRGAAINWTLIFFAALGALTIARAVSLRASGTDLFFDEAQYWSWSLEPAFGYYSKPPLVAWLIHAATTVCGHGEACVRLPSPLIHAVTSTVVFLLGSRLYDVRVGALSGLAFATLPGISVSAGIISTDVALLFAWAVALLALALMFETRSWGPALLLGLAFGIGLNAKYAMGWFLPCLACYLLIAPERRALLTDPRLYAAFALGLAMIVPNLLWNAGHGFATISHTADNANWESFPFHPDKALEFFAAQFGVFGPILFASLLVIVWRARKRSLPEPDRFLLAFSAPLIALMVVQAFLSRAHANWAAVAYVAAAVLVISVLVRDLDWRWLKASFAVNLALAAMIGAGTILAGRVAPPLGPDPFTRTLGWTEVAAATREKIDEARRAGRPFAAVVTDQRSITAELLYYMRDERTPVLAWRDGPFPRDHFEMTRPFTAANGEPVLLVSLAAKSAAHITRDFATVVDLGARDLPAGARDRRRVAFLSLAGYRGQ